MSKAYKNLRSALDVKCSYCNHFMVVNNKISTHLLDLNSNFAVIYDSKSQYTSIPINKDAHINCKELTNNMAIFFLECKEHHYSIDITLSFSDTDRNIFCIESFESLTLIPTNGVVYCVLNNFQNNTTRIKALDRQIFSDTFELSFETIKGISMFEGGEISIPIIPITNDIDYLLRTAKTLTSF